jgi:hypothetical protein
MRGYDLGGRANAVDWERMRMREGEDARERCEDIADASIWMYCKRGQTRGASFGAVE